MSIEAKGGDMKKYIACFILLAFIVTGSGCQGIQQSRIQTNPYPAPVKSLDMGTPSFVVVMGVAMAVTLATAVVTTTIRKQKKKRQFEELGSHVEYLMHQEAPASARFLGDVECREDSHTDVKKMLRIKAARLGGNLLVIDAITEVRENDTSLFNGSGRVYLVKDAGIQRTGSISGT
jgi:hypothetical protein